jgi:hypothetical protein
MSRRDTYHLQLTRDRDGGVTSVVLIANGADGDERQVCSSGSHLAGLLEPLRTLIGSRSGSRQWTGNRPIALDPRTGEHAELLMTAAWPLRRADRVAEIADGIAHMCREEAAYWHAKSKRKGGLRALRVLLTEGGR